MNKVGVEADARTSIHNSIQRGRPLCGHVSGVRWRTAGIGIDAREGEIGSEAIPGKCPGANAKWRARTNGKCIVVVADDAVAVHIGTQFDLCRLLLIVDSTLIIYVPFHLCLINYFRFEWMQKIKGREFVQNT